MGKREYNEYVANTELKELAILSDLLTKMAWKFMTVTR